MTPDEEVPGGPGGAEAAHEAARTGAARDDAGERRSGDERGRRRKRWRACDHSGDVVDDLGGDTIGGDTIGGDTIGGDDLGGGDKDRHKDGGRDRDDDRDEDGRRKGPARLEIRDLVVSFGGLRAVDHISITIEPGSIVGLIGPNGSGKTTLLDTVSGQVTPTGGELLLDGEDLADFIPEERAGMGVVRSFQDCRLYPELTVEDALLLCEDARQRVGVLSTTLQMPWAREAEREKRAAVDQVISSFGLERFRNHLTGHLSTGTRRVVDLASIVLARPRLLLLDEPTAGIAQREAEAFVPLLQRLHQVTGATILLVEHDVPLVFALCSTAIVMQTGREVASGPPDVVRRDPSALAAYLGASDAALNVSGPVAGAANLEST